MPNGRLLARKCTLTWARMHRVAHLNPPNRDEWPRFRSMDTRVTVFGGWAGSSEKFRFTTVGCARHRYPRVTTGPPSQKAAGVRCLDGMKCGGATARKARGLCRRRRAGVARPRRGRSPGQRYRSADAAAITCGGRPLGPCSVVGRVLIMIRWMPQGDWWNFSVSSAGTRLVRWSRTAS